MSPPPASVCVPVKHRGKVTHIFLPARVNNNSVTNNVPQAEAELMEGQLRKEWSIADLKQRIAEELHIPTSKQRLLTTAGGCKKLDDSDTLTSLGLGWSANGAVSTPNNTVMVIGNPEFHVVDGATGSGRSSSSSTLASTTTSVVRPPRTDAAFLTSVSVDTEEGMYTCAFTAGYVAQDAYYCRTCADAGYCEEAHFVCFACADVCHKGHIVENWGLHHSLRCDCCTEACATEALLAKEKQQMVSEQQQRKNTAESSSQQNNMTTSAPLAAIGDNLLAGRSASTAPSSLSEVEEVTFQRCRFVVDERTNEPPRQPLERNAKNKYPSTFKTWCYCKGENASEQDMCEGMSCALCHDCFYAPHITQVHSDWLLLMSCYAETDGCNTVGYRCRSCHHPTSGSPSTLYCPACIIHCHQGHDIDPEAVRIEWKTGETEAERSLVCGCRATCSIAHEVPDSLLLEWSDDRRRCRAADSAASPRSSLVPMWLAKQIVDDDEICAFVCTTCMQRWPWLWRGEEGDEDDLLSLRRCRKGQFPDVGVAPLQQPIACGGSATASTSTSASTSTTSSLLVGKETHHVRFPYHGMIIPDNLARFICQCNECQSAFKAKFPRSVSEEAIQLFVPYENSCSHCHATVERATGMLCATCELSQGATSSGASSSFFLCEACYSRPEVRRAHDAARDIDRNNGGRSHEFIVDTFENVWRVFGASIVSHVDRDTQQWMIENWNEGASRELVMELMRSTFGARRITLPSSASDAVEDVEKTGEEGCGDRRGAGGVGGKRPREDDEDAR